MWGRIFTFDIAPSAVANRGLDFRYQATGCVCAT